MILSLALAARRHQRRVKRSLRVLKRGSVVLAVAGLAGLVVWNKRKRGQVGEVSTGSKPIEAVGTQIAG